MLIQIFRIFFFSLSFFLFIEQMKIADFFSTLPAKITLLPRKKKKFNFLLY